MPTNFCNNRQDLICEKKYFLFLKNWNSLFSTEISQIRNLLQLSSIFSKKYIFKCVAKKTLNAFSKKKSLIYVPTVSSTAHCTTGPSTLSFVCSQSCCSRLVSNNQKAAVLRQRKNRFLSPNFKFGGETFSGQNKNGFSHFHSGFAA